MHSCVDSGQLNRHLLGILGEEGFVRFTQELGGVRVYVAYTMRDDNDVVLAVGRELADKLSRALAPATIRVPLARRQRALFYRARGLSNARIARRLGMTETGVTKLFGREAHLLNRPIKAKPAAQLTLL